MARRIARSGACGRGLVDALGRDEIGLDLADVLGEGGGLLVGSAFHPDRVERGDPGQAMADSPEALVSAAKATARRSTSAASAAGRTIPRRSSHA